MLTFLAGLGLGLSLIVAIGAQNVYVLRQGMRREHVLAVVAVCALSDAVLIAAGVAGLGLLIERAAWLVVLARWAGAVFLLVYGLMAARRAWQGQNGLQADDAPHPGEPAPADAGRGEVGRGEAPPADTLPRSPSEAAGGTAIRTRTPARARIAPVIATVLALTWLNPHVYLDTVLMLGSVAATHGDDRWIFAAGAALASCLWFTGLGFGARHLGRWLRTPRAWRLLDAGIAVVMICLAIGLVLPVLGQ